MDKKPRLGSDPLGWIRDTREGAKRTKRREVRGETRDLALLTRSSQANASSLRLRLTSFYNGSIFNRKGMFLHGCAP